MDRQYIYTYSGGRFYFDDPSGSDLKIEDIAHALSLICRWTGHVIEFYSVAQHSILVSEQGTGLRGLLHDAAEAFTSDINKPFKTLLGNVGEWEDQITSAIFDRFGVTEGTNDEVKRADKAVAMAEARDLLNQTEVPYYQGVEPISKRIVGWGSVWAERAFLERFTELGGKR